MISRCIIASIIVAVHTRLHFQSGYAEEEVEVGVNGESRQGDDIIVSSGLIINLILPVQRAGLDFLLKAETYHLHIAGMLYGHCRLVEVYLILNVVYTGCE